MNRALGSVIAVALLGAVACKETTTPLDLAGKGTSLTVASGDGQVAGVGDTLPQPLAVVMKDDAGNPVPGYAVRWSATAGTISTTADTTDATGIAQVGLILPDVADTVTVTATVDGFAPVTLRAVSAAAMAVAEGDGQVGATGSVLATPLTILMTDNVGNPIVGYGVTWVASGGTLTPLADTTGADGRVQATLTLPADPATVTVTARAVGMPDVVFNVAATPTGAPLVFRYVNAGSYHGCAITTTEMSVCWGFNEDGEAGTGSFSTIAPMTRVSSNRTVRVTSAGRYHSCEVTLSGDIWCGGSNTSGQVNGEPSSPAASFGQVALGTAFRVVQAGLLHTCALSLSQQLWCWGSNGEGQIGIGAIVPGSIVPADTAAFVGNNFAAVTTTGLHTCGLSTAGQAACWGYNSSGQLGNGTTSSSGAPVLVSGGLVFRTEPAVVPTEPDPDFYIPGQAYISAGFAHTCGIVASSNALMCWGENEDGQLGNNSRTDATAPVAVSGGLQFRAVSAGYRHTCGLTTAGVAYCWGDNSLGQLGDGTTTARLTPTAVSGGLAFMSISAGSTFSCGVTTTGVLYCWGDNVYGQLGQAGMARSLVPVKLPFQ
jgi:alpha-tubulin suppressor-like RCC1 family protein